MDTRIWCEFAKPKNVCKDFVLELLKKYKVTLNYKLEYGDEQEDFYDMIKLYNENSVPVSIWATLSDELGYWINESNAHHFDSYIKALIEKLEKRNLRIRGICVDMESPLQDVKRIISPSHKFEPLGAYAKMLLGNLNKTRFEKAKSILQNTAGYIREKGLESYVTCLRHCYYDLRFNSEILQNALEIPVFAVEWDKYNLMYYATMIRNELKKIKKVNVDYLIYHQVLYLKEKLKEKLAISIGVTNIGKLGNEPFYESMEEFSKDIGILKACGVEDFSLFSLDGIIEEKKLEQFLDVMQKAEPYKPEICKKVLRNEALCECAINLLKPYYTLRK